VSERDEVEARYSFPADYTEDMVRAWLAGFDRAMLARPAPPSEGLDAATVANDAIGLFLEYRDQHGYDEVSARSAAVSEVVEGLRAALAPESGT
jgi:hypothetical protein